MYGDHPDLHDLPHSVPARRASDLEDGVVAANSFFAREGMDAYVERRWLAPGAGVTLADVAQVVDDAGLSSFVLVGGTEEQVPRVGDFELDRKSTRLNSSH